MKIWSVTLRSHSKRSEIRHCSYEFEICHSRSFRQESEVVTNGDNESHLAESVGTLDVLTPKLFVDPVEFADYCLQDEWETAFHSCAIHRNSFEPDAIQMIKRWLFACKSHAKCDSQQAHDMPTYVLDVSRPDRLYLRYGATKGAYCFYSGCWGFMRKVFLSTANIRDYMLSGVSPASLPASWRDAAELTRLLGFSYLYIDGLCITHDVSETWHYESAKTPEYVRNASLVIASTAQDSAIGLRHQRPRDRTIFSIPYTYNDKNKKLDCSLSIRIPLKDYSVSVTQSTWAKRGWTLLERYFAPRMVIFGEEQIYWNCNTQLCSEGSTAPQAPLWELSCSAFPNRMANTVGRSTWYNIIEYYTSTCTLTIERDRLLAVGDLAASLAGGDRYYAGIWGDDLEIGLLWRRRGASHRIEHSADYYAPTWSWGYFTGAVSFGSAVTRRHQSHEDGFVCEIELDIIPRFGDNFVSNSRYRVDEKKQSLQYGLPASGYLILSAMSINVLDNQKSQQCTCLFDFDDFESQWNESKLELAVALISQWENITGNARRWHGLLLQRVEQEICVTVSYIRVGIYLGPLTPLRRGQGAQSPDPRDTLDEEWVRREFRIL